MTRRPFVCGNWKMHTGSQTAVSLALDVSEGAAAHSAVEVAIAPPFPWLENVARRLRDGPVSVAAQNCHFEEKGAFTGEVSPGMLRDAGCTHVIVGHSERRTLFGEDDSLVSRKVAAVLAASLRPILCVGETLEEREAGSTMDVVGRQVQKGLGKVELVELPLVTIAYEPVWAIGTGRTATPEQAQEVHAAIREIICSLGGEDAGSSMRIQYGGSVKAANARELMSMKDVDGALVGGASLDAFEFTEIIAAAAENA